MFQALMYLVGPECEADYDWTKGSVWNSHLDRHQELYNELANRSGLAGGDSNRCFQKFMVRYTDYNMTAYEALVDFLAKYLYQEISVYGYCLAIRGTWDDSSVRDDWIRWAEQGIRTILKRMSDAVEIFDEPRPTPVTTASTTAGTDPFPNETTDESTASAQYPGQTTDATEASTGGSIPLADIKHVVDLVLRSEGIKGSMDWAKRAGRHKNIADKIYQNLTAAYDAHYGVSFQVLVSLLQDEAPNDMLCMDSESNRSIQSYSSDGASYFVQYFYKTDLSAGFNATWEGIEKKNTEILDAFFTLKSQNLCKAAKEQIEKAVNMKVFGLEDEFSGLAVVRCGRQFVWYELGYRYFTVGRTAGPSFTLTSANDGTYNANCGQIFLFP